MKINIKNIKTLSMGFAVAASLAATVSCSDDFLSEKRPYGAYSPEEVYSDMTSVNLRLNHIYMKSLPYHGSKQENNDPDTWPIGYKDNLSNNADEFTGYGRFTNPSSTWDYANIPKYFFYGTNESPWKKMRECTEVIDRVAQSTTLTPREIGLVDGQARFFRATRYYRLFKRYGGLPLIPHIQSILVTDRDSLAVPRHSTKETFDFIINDLTTAAAELPARWDEEANDWGRITSGACLALAGVVANYYASPVFNRQDDRGRWEQAYELNKKAIETLDAGHFGLAYEGLGGENAKNWARMWTNIHCGTAMQSEAVFQAICSSNIEDSGHGLSNNWEQVIRPANALGGGGLEPSAEEVDMFPMADGKRPGASAYTYNKKIFFLNRDPRFYRTFAFPGVEWRFVGNIELKNEDGTIDEDTQNKVPYTDGSKYRLVNFAFYDNEENANNELRSGWFTDKMTDNGHTVYIRKKTQDAYINAMPFYNYTKNNKFSYNGAPAVYMRYTEVLLNLAEAACGVDKLDEAWNILVRIRQRVGYTGDCGLDPAIRGDRAKMFEAILYERRVELAYEGKRFDDCVRWMLFDGGENITTAIPEAPESWEPTGWGGNTCKYLGVTPLNEIERHKIEIYIDTEDFTIKAEDRAKADPWEEMGVTIPQALTLDEDMTTSMDENGVVHYKDSRVEAWAKIYNNMHRKDIKTMKSDVTDEEGNPVGNDNPVWDPHLYIMGLASGDQNQNPGIVQTMGWQSRFGGMGVFDPLSDNPVTNTELESAK